MAYKIIISVLGLSAVVLGLAKAIVELKKSRQDASRASQAVEARLAEVETQNAEMLAMMEASREEENAFREAVLNLIALMDESRYLLGAKRCLLIVTENSGNVRNREGRRYITVMYEALDYPFQPCRKDFVRYPVDEEYHALIDRLLAEKRVLLEPDTMDEDSFLRNVYLERKIVGSRVQVVHETVSKLCYLSYNFIEEKVDFEGPEHLAILDRFSHQIGQIINRFPRTVEPPSSQTKETAI